MAAVAPTLYGQPEMGVATSLAERRGDQRMGEVARQPRVPRDDLRRRDQRPPRRVSFQKTQELRGVGIRGRFAAAVVLGVGNQPQFLGVLAVIEQAPRDLRPDVRVALAVNHQPGPGRQPGHGRLDAGEPAIQRPLGPAPAASRPGSRRATSVSSRAERHSARRSRPSEACS